MRRCVWQPWACPPAAIVTVNWGGEMFLITSRRCSAAVLSNLLVVMGISFRYIMSVSAVWWCTWWSCDLWLKTGCFSCGSCSVSVVWVEVAGDWRQRLMSLTNCPSELVRTSYRIPGCWGTLLPFNTPPVVATGTSCSEDRSHPLLMYDSSFCWVYTFPPMAAWRYSALMPCLRWLVQRGLLVMVVLVVVMLVVLAVYWTVQILDPSALSRHVFHLMTRRYKVCGLQC